MHIYIASRSMMRVELCGGIHLLAGIPLVFFWGAGRRRCRDFYGNELLLVRPRGARKRAVIRQEIFGNFMLTKHEVPLRLYSPSSDRIIRSVRSQIARHA